MDKIDVRQLFEIDNNDCSNATFFTDFETGELIYLNGAMEKKFQIFEDYTGKQARDVIPYYEDICGFHDKNELLEGVYVTQTFLSEMLNANLRSQSVLWKVCQRKFIQTKYFLAPAHDKQKEAENLFERAIARCLEILSDTNTSSPNQDFLELLGEYYQCEHSFICEFNRKDDTLSEAFMWSKDGRMKELPCNESVPMVRFIAWLEQDKNISVINLDKTEHNYESLSFEEIILNKYHLDNVTLGKLWDKEGHLSGIIGLSDRSELMYDDRLLQAISHFIMEQFSQKSMLETLEDLNDIDVLTGFYNHSKYSERVLELQNNPPKCLGVIFANLNGLRATNEFLSYDAGDAQLKNSATMLNEYFNSIFYRVTGDEFVGFLPDCDQDIFEDTIHSLQHRLKEQHKDALFSFGHSWESGSYNVLNMVKIADTVMVINKQSYYHDSLKEKDRISNTLLKDLFRGIEEGEFKVYLQPQVDLNTNQVIGGESLIRRFDKKKQKMVFPDQFIPAYEENSIIRHIDLFVIRKVCQLMQKWKQQGTLLQISVNLSRITLVEHGIVKTVRDILDEYGIDPSLIMIEITERMGVVDNDVATSLVEEFRENGFHLSLDDFGCAYSNIVTLAQITVDEVKIDKSLVDNVLTNQKNAVIVKSMLTMCQGLGDTYTLAEGIESAEQAEFLKNAHCQYGQGYLYAKPMPSGEFFDKYIKNAKKE
ncbi:MAG: bifunctional diguanylate cyclase/phosphodiesterase [Eubacteriales bacterium]